MKTFGWVSECFDSDGAFWFVWDYRYARLKDRSVESYGMCLRVDL